LQHGSIKSGVNSQKAGVAMPLLPYQLQNHPLGSDGYYRDVDAFADQVLEAMEASFGPWLDDFRSFVGAAGIETPRSRPEYGLELLMLGTLWRTVGGAALGAVPLPLYVSAGLAGVRRVALFKAAADWGRGILLTAWGNYPSRSAPDAAPTLAQLDKLLRWLRATGDFGQEVIRLRAWRTYLRRRTPEEAARILAGACDCAAWFARESAAVLGRYTPEVERFLAEEHSRYRFREDWVFCGRRREEYHLNMVGAALMNRAFRPEFLARPRQAVLLPACLRREPGGGCRAVRSALGWQCRECAAGCGVRQLTRLGRKYDFEVYFVPHESSLFARGVAAPEVRERLGVVGVACVLNLLSGGWKVKALGIPVQCVLLNYSGCPKHWLKEGLMTEINHRQLLKVLGKAECHPEPSP
jgi:hypothetical protein